MGKEDLKKWLNEQIGYLEKTKANPDKFTWDPEYDYQLAAFRLALERLEPVGPLTLEQLREKRGKWVWIISPDEHMTVEAWAYVGESQVFTYWEYQEDKIVGRVVYNMCDYGAWLAYDYPPAHIDREAWASVNEQMPDEHDSIFKKLIAKEKWGAGMFERLSDDVIVAVKFADGTRRSGFAHTKDGVWMGLPSIGCPVVTHWMPLPEPPKEE